jgi:hypothetical protein
MRYFLKNFITFSFVSITVFLVGCSGTGTISANGTLNGSGRGTVSSQSNGTASGNQSTTSLQLTMSNPTDTIVCTTPSGVVTVYTPGQAITSSGNKTCVDTPASTGSTTTTGGTTGTTGSGTSSGTSTTSATNPANSF